MASESKGAGGGGEDAIMAAPGGSQATAEATGTIGASGGGAAGGGGDGSGAGAAAAAAAAAGAGAGAGASMELDKPPEGFELEPYAAKYSGNGKLLRLKFIAQHAAAPLGTAARVAAIDACKADGWNTRLYKELIETAPAGTLDDAHVLDTAWVAMTEKKSDQKHGALEQSLSTYLSNMLKENVRIGYNDLAQFYEQRGELAQAAKCYGRTRDYCHDKRHTMSMCINAVRVGILMGSYPTLHPFLSKAEANPDMSDDVIGSKVRVCAGMLALHAGDFRHAARNFFEVNIALGTSFTEIVHPDDIAVYGGLCALASYTRSALRAAVFDSPNFKAFMELAPRMRDLLQDFVSSQYARCLEVLDELKPELKLDMFLRDHVDTLYARIRSAAIVQYFTPYSTVSLVTMADSFHTTVDDLERELAALIMADRLAARIDSHKKVLHTRHANERISTYEGALEAGKGMLSHMKAMVLRSNLNKHQFSVSAPRRGVDVDGGGRDGDGGIGRGGGGMPGEPGGMYEELLADAAAPQDGMSDYGMGGGPGTGGGSGGMPGGTM